MKPSFLPSQTEAKYKNMRISLLILIVLSFLNMFSIWADTYFLFSAYIPNLLAIVGFSLYLETNMIFFYALFVIIAIACLIPYLLAFIFSKKHVGWSIAALAFFTIDSIVFLIDFASTVLAGYFYLIPDFAIRIYVFITLVLAVKYGFDAKKERAEKEAVQEAEPASEEQSDSEEITRSLTIRRKKSFIGCAMKIIVFVNGQPVAELKNGADATVPVTSKAFALGATFTNTLAAMECTIPEGEYALDYTLQIKMGLSANQIIVVPTSSLQK